MDNTSNIDFLAIDNQVCFALYVCSKEVIKKYTPLLEPLGLTYTSYIVLLALWEKDNVLVKDLGNRLFLDSGTLTPLLKKMEKQNLITRTRSKEDERQVFITLTEEGKNLKSKCYDIPQKIGCNFNLSPEKAKALLDTLHEIMSDI